MWRFFVFPLVISVGVTVASALYIFTSTLVILPVLIMLPANFADSGTMVAAQDSGLRTETIWAYLLIASLLLGVALAGYEIVLYRMSKTAGSLPYLAYNIWWFNLYASVISALIVIALNSIAPSDPQLYLLMGNFGNIYYSWSGFVIVTLASLYSMHAERVLTPQTLLHRIRHGRFNSSDN